MPHLSIPHRIERTQNRSSRAIKNGTIVIRLAGRLHFSEEQHHIDVLLGRMMKVALREAERPKIDPFLPLLHDRSKSLEIALCTGESIRFDLRVGKRLHARSGPFGWKITCPERIARTALHRFLWKTFGAAQKDAIDTLVREINDRTLRVPIQKVTLKNMHTRFGSCSRKGNIALATALLCTTKELMEYVIIHELTHMQHMNHSKAFWKTVGDHCPGYKDHLRALQKLRLPSAS